MQDHGAEGAFITSEFDGEDLEKYKGLLCYEELSTVCFSTIAGKI
jgi:hypothetical protein